MTICDILWCLWRSKWSHFRIWDRGHECLGVFSFASETKKVWPKQKISFFLRKFPFQFGIRSDQTGNFKACSVCVCIPDRTDAHTFESATICDNHRCHIISQMVTNLVLLLPIFKNLWETITKLFVNPDWNCSRSVFKNIVSTSRS